MSSRSPLSQTPPFEVLRVSQDDARYILSSKGSIITAGERSVVASKIRSKFGLSNRQCNALFAQVDKHGRNSSLSTWGIGRIVSHAFDNGVKYTILEKDFGTLVDDIESTSVDHAVGASGGSGYLVQAFNGTNHALLFSAAQRLDIPPSLISRFFDKDSFTEPKLLGTLNRGFRYVILDVGMALAEASGVSSDSKRGQKWLGVKWGAAASFLLADIRVDEDFQTSDEAIAAAMETMLPFVGLDSREVIDVLFTDWLHWDIYWKTGDDAREVLLLAIEHGFPLSSLLQLMKAGMSVEDICTMIRAGVDGDIALAVRNGSAA